MIWGIDEREVEIRKLTYQKSLGSWRKQLKARVINEFGEIWAWKFNKELIVKGIICIWRNTRFEWKIKRGWEWMRLTWRKIDRLRALAWINGWENQEACWR